MTDLSKPKPAEPLEGELLEKELEAAGIPPAKAKAVLKVVSTHTSRISWRGPLPPPEVFRQYPSEVQKAIVRQANAQMKHRHTIEEKVITSNIAASSKGMNLAFWITVSMIVAGTILVALGHSTSGLIAIFGTGGFQGGNYLLQRWHEMQQASDRAKQQNGKQLSKHKKRTKK